MSNARPNRRTGLNHRGSLAVEMSLVLPLLFLVVLTSIEFSRMNVIRHTASNAAYEGARRGIVPGATAADVENVARGIMAATGARGVTVTVTPAVIDIDTPEIIVEVSVSCHDNGFLAPKFFNGATFVGVSRLRREDF